MTITDVLYGLLQAGVIGAASFGIYVMKQRDKKSDNQHRLTNRKLDCMNDAWMNLNGTEQNRQIGLAYKKAYWSIWEAKQKEDEILEKDL